VCIIGEVGSGKTSLISALLADMTHLSPEVLENLKDKETTPDVLEEMIQRSNDKAIVKVSGSISLV
jgi:Ni2+-binding GTPase involved in maturation of urease and hydrogenase